MSIGEMQACLGRLYVDELFRKLFRRDPGATLADYRLDAAERNALCELDAGMLEYFAASLTHKRRKRIERAFPLLFALDRAELEHYFARFHQLHALKPRQPVHQDVLDFGEFIEETLVDAPGPPAYASELARYERLYYAAMFSSPPADDDPAPKEVSSLELTARPRCGPGVCVAAFEYDVVAIEEALEAAMARAVPDAEPADPPQASPSPCSIVFRPVAPGAARRMLRINDATHAVLDRCDGERTLAQIVADTEAELGACGLERGIVTAVERLVTLGVLVTGTGTPGATRGSAAPAAYYPEAM